MGAINGPSMIASVIIDVIASTLLGSMVFFAAVVAPVVFRTLETDQADAFLQAFFPRAALWGIVISVVGLGYCLFHSPKSAALLALILVGFVYARQLLYPAIHEARSRWRESEHPGDKARFTALHRRSMIIYMAQMGMLLVIIIG